MSEDVYLWVTRWFGKDGFQHYRPERDRGPAWIKQYPKQLDDHRYTDLSPRARALLHDVRMVFARCAYRVRIPSAPRMHRDRTAYASLSQRCAQRVYTADLEALNHAGFIEFISRETLEQRLEELYSPPRARVEGEEELDPPPTPPQEAGGQDRPPATNQDQRTQARRTKKNVPPALQRAENFVRNAGAQYAQVDFEEELARFNLQPHEYDQVHALYDHLRPAALAAMNGDQAELPWDGDEPPIVT